ncbi:hypothetical protein N8137_02580 [Porticoccaceae bacterium]|nr:hypothetical protein [Porticoccaceae bacterium]
MTNIRSNARPVLKPYLKFNIQSDQVYAAPENVYFKLRSTFSDGQYKEEVFASEEHFPLLLKIMQSDEDLSKSLAFDSHGEHFTKMIAATQDKYGYIDELDMSFFLEKESSWISWPSKIDDLHNQWYEDSDLQDDFPLIEDFISNRTEEELWSLYEMWELDHGKKIDLTQSNLTDYSSGGWALDGYYMEDPHTFVGFTNIAGVEIEYYDGDLAKILTGDELKAMLDSQYGDEADQLENLLPATLIDRGIRRKEYKSTERIKTKARYRKIAILICIAVAYFAWLE